MTDTSIRAELRRAAITGTTCISDLVNDGRVKQWIPLGHLIVTVQKQPNPPPNGPRPSPPPAPPKKRVRFSRSRK